MTAASLSLAGMHPATGLPVTGLARLHLLVADVLTTPRGSRLCRRDYGSDLPALIDQPLNDLTIQQIYAATAEALAEAVPELELGTVSLEALDSAAPGTATITITATVNLTGESVILSIPFTGVSS